ncbi:Calcium-dependent protein kinase [Mactra antiquata]
MASGFPTVKVEWNEEIEKRFDLIFDMIDKDHNGVLTFDEVKSAQMIKVLRLLGHNPVDGEVKEYMDNMDKNGDGVVSRDEFKTYVQEMIEILKDPVKLMAHAIDVMFKACDLDKNGLISKNEFRIFMQKSGKQIQDRELDEIFRRIDMDGDVENLSKDELTKLFTIGKEFIEKRRADKE